MGFFGNFLYSFCLRFKDLAMLLVTHGEEFLLCLTLIQLLGKKLSWTEARIAINFLYDSFGYLILFIIYHEILCDLDLKTFIRFS